MSNDFHSHSDETRQNRDDLIIAIFASSLKTQITVFQLMEEMFPEQSKEIFAEFIDSSYKSSFFKFAKSFLERYSNRKAIANNFILLPILKYFASKTIGDIDIKDRVEAFQKLSQEKRDQNDAELLVEKLKDLQISPEIDELSKTLFNQPIPITILIRIGFRYFDLAEKNNNEYLYCLALLLNEGYTAIRDLSYLVDLTNISAVERISRLVDICRMPVFISMVLFRLNIKDFEQYKEFTNNFPFLRNEFFLESFSILAILNASGVEPIKIGGSTDFKTVSTSVKGTAAYINITVLEKLLFLRMMRRFPILLALSDPKFREKDRSPVLKPTIEEIANYNDEEIVKKATERLEQWVKRDQSDSNTDSNKKSKNHKDSTTKNEIKLSSVLSLRMDILIILQVIDIIPFLGPKKREFENFLLQKLENMKNMLLNSKIINCNSIPLTHLSTAYKFSLDVAALRNEILALIKTIKQLLLALNGVQQPAYIYGNLKNCLLNLLRLWIKWFIHYEIWYLIWLEELNKKFKKFLENLNKRSELVRFRCYGRPLKKEKKRKRKYFKEVVVHYIIIPFMLFNVLKHGVMQNNCRFSFTLDYSVPMETVKEQIPNGSVLVFEDNSDFESSTLDESKLKKQTNPESQSEITQKTLESLDDLNLSKLKPQFKKRRIFIHIPSLNKNFHKR